ncbi:MAG: hypothetical protein KAU31_02865 [Spirochaetaceae bacterium]|nr:hypothetical protein [Spirochaetaceae bacterium]
MGKVGRWRSTSGHHGGYINDAVDDRLQLLHVAIVNPVSHLTAYGGKLTVA